MFRTVKKPAGLGISTVVKTFRDLEVPPALPSYEDGAKVEPGTVTDRNGPGSAAHQRRRLRLRRNAAPGTRGPLS